MKKHKIGWTHFPGYKGETWNPVTGCSSISPGCDHCYAERISKRFGWPWGKPIFHINRLCQPSHWKKPRAIFVCSMSDLFHEGITAEEINKVWMQIFNNPRHLFLILTKRPKRMLEWTTKVAHAKWWPVEEIWPDNVWLGVTVENADYLNRIDILRDTPAAHKFVSFEPLLGAIPDVDLTGIDWVICGGESGPGARPMKSQWPVLLLHSCFHARVPFFMKQMSEFDGADKHDIPPFLDVKQFPEVSHDSSD